LIYKEYTRYFGKRRATDEKSFIFSKAV